MQTEAYVQGQLVRGSLLNVVRHVINSLNFLSVKLCFFHSVLSYCTWVKERMKTYFSVCLTPECLPHPHQFSLVFSLSLFCILWLLLVFAEGKCAV